MPRRGRIRATRGGAGGGPRSIVMALLLGLGLLQALLVLAVPAVAAAEYDEALARRMVVYSSIAISEPEQVDAWAFPNPLCNAVVAGDWLVQTFRARDTAYGYIVQNDHERFLLAAFKGSNDTRDWIEHDLRSMPFKYHRKCTVDKATGATLPGHVHHGLCTYWTDLVALGMADRLVALARANPEYTLFITGHSLGGAAAALCAADLLHRFGVRSTLYTFGEPRVGDYDFARILTEGAAGRSYRVVHDHDLVPHLGTCCGREIGNWSCLNAPMCPFHHNTEIFYENHMALTALFPGRYTVCAEEEDLSCSNALRDVAFSVRDHERYFGVDVSMLCRWAPPLASPPQQQDGFWEGLLVGTDGLVDRLRSVD